MATFYPEKLAVFIEYTQILQIHVNIPVKQRQNRDNPWKLITSNEITNPNTLMQYSSPEATEQ